MHDVSPRSRPSRAASRSSGVTSSIPAFRIGRGSHPSATNPQLGLGIGLEVLRERSTNEVPDLGERNAILRAGGGRHRGLDPREVESSVSSNARGIRVGRKRPWAFA